MRLVRGVRKMRLERAILLDVLARRMRKGGADDAPLGLYDDDSEDSSDSPPTVRTPNICVAATGHATKANPFR